MSSDRPTPSSGSSGASGSPGGSEQWSARTTQVMAAIRLPSASTPQEAKQPSNDSETRLPAVPAPERTPFQFGQRLVNQRAFAFRTLCFLPLAATLGLLLGLSLFNESPAAMSLKMIFTAVLLLSLKRWTGSVLFGFVLLDLLVREPRRSQLTNPGDAVVFVVAVITLLMLTSRFRTLRQSDGRSMFRLLQSVLAGTDLQDSAMGQDLSREVDRRDPFAISPTLFSLVSSIGVVVILTLSAILLLNRLPAFRSFQSWLEETPDGSFRLWPGPLILVLVIAAVVIVSELAWRNLTSRQSRLYLRSVLVMLNFRDLRMIARKRLNIRRRRRKIDRLGSKKDARDAPPSAIPDGLTSG